MNDIITTSIKVLDKISVEQYIYEHIERYDELINDCEIMISKGYVDGAVSYISMLIDLIIFDISVEAKKRIIKEVGKIEY